MGTVRFDIRTYGGVLGPLVNKFEQVPRSDVQSRYSILEGRVSHGVPQRW